MFDKSTIYGEKKDPEFLVRKYTCKSCGAVFCTDKSYKTNTCFLCGHHSFEKEEYNDTRKLLVLPFVKEEREVLKDYQKKIAWNPLIPFSFKKKKNYQVIQKVFLPAFFVNVNQKGKIVFLAGDKEKITEDGKKINILKKYEVHQLVNFDYKEILINTSTKIDNKLFVNICNYDYGAFQRLDSSIIKDSIYLLGDVEATEIGVKGRDRISKRSLLEVRNHLRHQLRKLKKDESVISFYDAEEVLVPIYIINIKYRNKIYSYMMNGQNGTSYFYIPIGILETILFSAILMGILFLITYLLVSYW